jgi:hypothetical protein
MNFTFRTPSGDVVCSASARHKRLPERSFTVVKKENSVCSTGSSNSESELYTTATFPLCPYMTEVCEDQASLCESLSSNVDEHEAYMSCLADDQPLYQHFTFHETDKLLLGEDSPPAVPEEQNESAERTLVAAELVKAAAMDCTAVPSPPLPCIGSSLHTTTTTETLLSTTTTVVPPSPIPTMTTTTTAKESAEEADSVCCDTDDATSVSVIYSSFFPTAA